MTLISEHKLQRGTLVTRGELFSIFLKAGLAFGGGLGILAVLEDAIQCYLNYWNEPSDMKKRRCAWEANQWIDSPSRTGLFAYENVCLLLEIEPERLRRELRRLASRKRGWEQTSMFNRRVLGTSGATTAKNGKTLKSA